MIIRELLTRWGITVDDAKLDAFEKKLGGAVVTAAAVAAGAVAAGAGLLKLAQDAAVAGDDAAKTARNIGITAESLQELRHAAALSGLQADQLTDSLKDLQKNSSAAAKGDKGLAAALAELGLNAREFNKLTADKKLEALADGLQRIKDPARAAELRMKILGEVGFKMQSLLAGGSAGIRAMREEARALGIVIAEDTTQAAEGMNDALDRVRAVGRGLALQLGAQLIPVITEAAVAVKGWLLENRALVASGLEQTVDAATAAFKGAWSAIRFMGAGVAWLVDKLGGLNRVLFYTKFLIATFVTYKAGAALYALIGVIQAARAAYLTMGAAAAWAQVKAFALPIALAALVVIVGLLIDDFAAFFSGQKSGIGELVEKYPELGGALWMLHDAWIEAGKVAEEFFDEWIAAWPEFKALVWDAIFSIIDGFNDLEAEIPASFERAKMEALAIVDQLVRDIALRLAGIVARVEVVADTLGLDAPALRAARMGFETVGAIGSAPRLGDAAAPRVAGAAAQLQRSGGGITIEGSTFQVTQLPGEDGVVFAQRVADEVERKRASQLRQARAATEGGMAW